MANLMSETAPWLGGSARFETTRWSVILRAGRQSPERARALDQFCCAYWYPVYAFVRQRGHGVDDAHDLTQEFFARLLGRDSLAGVEQGDSRFSTLLLTMLKRFLVNEYEREQTVRRGRGQAPLSIDTAQAEAWFGAEPATHVTPEKIFERTWALSVLEAALGHLCAEAEAVGKSHHFQMLSPFLSREPDAGDYEKAGAALQMNARAVAVAVRRLRSRYRDALRQELAGGRLSRSQAEEQMRDLFVALAVG